MSGEERAPEYIHIEQNEFWHRKHKKQKEEDTAVCECKGECEWESCLNALTSTECSPNCGLRCNNQRFQRRQYANTRLFNTDDHRGWGLLADQHIQAGHFIIEYCGEVISWKEAKRRSHAYHRQGITAAYIISLSAAESIDATKKGSLARFINHSCLPNCETRKWNVLGEVRVGIFAKQDIPAGTELSYDYNFEWYGGAKVRCLCGAPTCSGFLGAKSRGFQEDTYLWEDDDDRYSVEKIPLYDSAEDEPSAKHLSAMADRRLTDVKADSEEKQFLSTPVVQSLDSGDETKVDVKELSLDSGQTNSQNNAVMSHTQKYENGPRSKPKKRSKRRSNGRLKTLANQVDAKAAALLLPSKEAQEELLKLEEIRNESTSRLEMLYDEIRPSIEEHERDNQDSVATSVAEKWIEASSMKLKTEFDLYFSIVKNIATAKALDY